VPPAKTLSDVIAAGIRAERARRAWTQAELAQRAGLSRNTVGDIEARKRIVTVDYLLTFCKAFGVPAAVLAQGADPHDLRALGL
jgi:transcriptional regulator with XRE-family HTH domain